MRLTMAVVLVLLCANSSYAEEAALVFKDGTTSHWSNYYETEEQVCTSYSFGDACVDKVELVGVVVGTDAQKVPRKTIDPDSELAKAMERRSAAENATRMSSPDILASIDCSTPPSPEKVDYKNAPFTPPKTRFGFGSFDSLLNSMDKYAEQLSAQGAAQQTYNQRLSAWEAKCLSSDERAAKKSQRRQDANAQRMRNIENQLQNIRSAQEQERIRRTFE